MNISSTPLKAVWVLVLSWGCVWGVLPQTTAQNAITFDRIQVVSGTTATYSFYSGSIVYLPQISQQPQYGSAQLLGGNNPNLGVPGNNELYYTPDPGFLGLDTVGIDYWVLNPYGSADPADLFVAFEVVPSVVTAQNDFATTTQGTSVTVDVLANDFTVGGNVLKISSIALSNNGQVSLNADSTLATFTPGASFSGLASFHYTICDDVGTCDVAVATIQVIADTPPVSDTIQLFTIKNQAQVVLMDVSGYQLSQAPAHGTLQMQAGRLWYQPDAGFTGWDEFIYTKTVGQDVFTRTAIIQVFDAPDVQTFAFNDVAFTTPDTSVEVAVYHNDVGGTTLEFVLGQDAAHGTVTYLGSGVFAYEPDAGFEGVDKFTYLAYPAGFSGAPEEAIVYVVVSSFEPADSVFPLTTTKDKPLVVGYNIPVFNYSLSILTQPQHGTVAYYPGWHTLTIGGQIVEGFNLLVYTPDSGFSGSDSFDFSYCIGANSNNCPSIQVQIEVKDIAVPADQYCVAKHCVWPGDVNWDGKVDLADLLPIGLCMGEVGEARANPNLNEWYGQFGEDWGLQLGLMGFDAKNVDTDGDGVVSASDTAAIAAFYGQVHLPYVEPLPAIEGLQPYIVPLDTVISPGDVLEAQIWLGTPEYPVQDGYGISFSIAYEPSIFEEVQIDFEQATQSWLGYDSPLLYMTHQPTSGRLDAAITRTSGKAVHGYGIIGTIRFIVVDDLPGFKIGQGQVQLPIQLQGGTFMLGSGYMGALPGAQTQVTLRWGATTKEDVPVTDASLLKAYPNPARDVLDLHINGWSNEFNRVQLFTLAGQMLYDSGQIWAKHWQMSVRDYPPGMYVVRAITTAGTISKKIQVAR